MKVEELNCKRNWGPFLTSKDAGGIGQNAPAAAMEWFFEKISSLCHTEMQERSDEFTMYLCKPHLEVQIYTILGCWRAHSACVYLQMHVF